MKYADEKTRTNIILAILDSMSNADVDFWNSERCEVCC